MSTTFIINIAVEIFSSILSLVFILCILILNNMKAHVNRAFVRVLVFNMAVMLSDALAFFSIGKTEPVFLVTNYIGNYCTYLFSYLLIMAFTDYLVTYISTKVSISRSAVYAVYAVCGFAIALSVVALFNNMYFTIDENNVYHRQDLYWLSQVLGIVGMLINAAVIIRYRKHFNRMESIALASYIIFPVIAIVIQTMVYGFVSVYVASTLTIVLIYVGMQAQQARDIKAKELALTESRVAIMLSQIHPHFLYNSLVSISELIDLDPKEAKEMTLAFARYLRGNMDSLGEARNIPFTRELEHVKNYLLVEQKRFGDRLRVEFDIRAKDFTLPALTVQPIVENAVRYGVTKRKSGGTVRIRTEETARGWNITVWDDGVGFDTNRPPSGDRSHVGIENVKSRLYAVCGGSLDIKSVPGEGTTAVITVPKDKPLPDQNGDS